MRVAAATSIRTEAGRSRQSQKTPASNSGGPKPTLTLNAWVRIGLPQAHHEIGTYCSIADAEITSVSATTRRSGISAASGTK